MAKSKNELALFGGKPILSKPLAPYNSIGEEEKRAVNELMEKVVKGKATLSGFLARRGESFLGGPLVRQLEKDFQDYFKIRHAISFNSATTALQAAVAALHLKPGDQVITSPYTMCATSSAILANNCVPVFADVDPLTYCISAKTIEPKITNYAKAILVVNLLGNCPDYDEILKLAQKYNLLIIEDNAQAPGGMYNQRYTGTIGDIGVFSFNVHKTMQAGEGGMLLTNSDRYAYRAQLVRNHGEAIEYEEEIHSVRLSELMAGSNFRLSELHAAIMIEQFKKLDKLNDYRIQLANHLSQKLQQFPWLREVCVALGTKHVYYLYPIKFFQKRIGISRSLFVKAMLAEGFSIGEGYNIPAYWMPIYHWQNIYKDSHFPFVSKDYPQIVEYSPGMCPVVERLYQSELLTTTLCQPPTKNSDIDLLIEAIRKVEKNIDKLKEYERKKTTA